MSTPPVSLDVSVVSVCHLGLLHIGPVQLWLKGCVPRRAWRAGNARLSRCTDTLARQELVCRESVWAEWFKWKLVTTDTSPTGWGPLCDGRPAFGTWICSQTRWHINCLFEGGSPSSTGVFAVCKRPSCSHSDGQYSGGGVHQSPGGNAFECPANDGTAPHSMGGSDIPLDPGRLNYGADRLSREGIVHGEWRLHRRTVSLIWSLLGDAEINRFASEENVHCPFFFSLTNVPLIRDALSSSWPRGRKYAFPWSR